MRKKNKAVRVTKTEYNQYSSTSDEQSMSLWPGIALALVMYYGGYTYSQPLYTGIILVILALVWDCLVGKLIDILIIRGTPLIAALLTVLFGVLLAFGIPIWWVVAGCIIYVAIMLFK